MVKYTIDELKRLMDGCTYEKFIEVKEKVKDDERKSVQNIIKKYEKKFEMLKRKMDEYNKRKKYENELYKHNYRFIAGIDEVGRGPLAGPVYAAAVILNPEADILEIKDSKKLSPNQRQKIAEDIKQKCIAYSVAFASVEEIERLNILNAAKLAMKRAIEGLKVEPDFLLIDAVKLDDVKIPQMSIIRGDDLSISIGAASIVAKVERDNFMDTLSLRFPQYMFDKNKGYGTQEHIEAIKKYGICEMHRRLFVQNFI